MSQAEINPFRLEQRVKPAENHAVLSGFEFLEDFRNEARNSSKRVWGQAMAIYPSHPGQLFLESFREAAKRGVDTRLNIDWFTLLASENGINKFVDLKKFFSGDDYSEFLRDHDYLTFHELAFQSDVDVHFTNPPKFFERYFPYTGRNHIKIYIVDNIAYLGGINIGDDSFKGVDFAVKFTDREVVDELAKQFVFGEKQEKDYSVSFNNGDKLLVDAGISGQSVILDTAINLIRNARSSVVNISFFAPDSPLVKALSDADKRGPDVEVIMPEGQWGLISPFGLIDRKNKFQNKLFRRKVDYVNTPQRIHAKLLIIDDEIALFGSHNLMHSGVSAGTSEIAYLTRNPQIVTNLKEFYDKVKSGELTEMQ